MNEDLPEDVSRNGAIERAIGRAVRTMMQVDPPAGLRRRVLARLDAPVRRASLFPRLAMGLAAVAVLVLAVVLIRPAPETGAPPIERAAVLPPASAPAPPTSPAPVTNRATPLGVPAPVTIPRRAARPVTTDTPIPMPRVANVFGTRDTGVSAASAAGVQDMVFPAAAEASGEPPGMPGAIGVPRITIAPLQIERISIEPIPTRK